MKLRWLAPLLLPSLVVALRPRIVMLRVSDPTDRDQNFGEGDQLAVNILPYLGNDVYVFESRAPKFKKGPRSPTSYGPPRDTHKQGPT